MSGPDGIDERFGTLAGELRSGEVTASPELRERVRAIATREPEPPAARLRARLPRRRVALVLVPVCALVAAAVGVGVFTSGGSNRSTEANTNSIQKGLKRSAGNARAFIPHAHSLPITVGQAPTPGPTPGLNAFSQDAFGAGYVSSLPPSGQRHQLYSADLRLRVSDLSGTTKK